MCALFLQTVWGCVHSFYIRCMGHVLLLPLVVLHACVCVCVCGGGVNQQSVCDVILPVRRALASPLGQGCALRMTQ